MLLCSFLCIVIHKCATSFVAYQQVDILCWKEDAHHIFFFCLIITYQKPWHYETTSLLLSISAYRRLEATTLGSFSVDISSSRLSKPELATGLAKGKPGSKKQTVTECRTKNPHKSRFISFAHKSSLRTEKRRRKVHFLSLTEVISARKNPSRDKMEGD